MKYRSTPVGDLTKEVNSLTVQELMQVLLQLPKDTEVVVAVAEIEERFLTIGYADTTIYNKQLVLVLEPNEFGYDA